jgi:hypothetical protein
VYPFFDEGAQTTMPQPALNLGLLGAASKDAGAARGEESKFDHVMALQEEPIQVGAIGIGLAAALN